MTKQCDNASHLLNHWQMKCGEMVCITDEGFLTTDIVSCAQGSEQ